MGEEAVRGDQVQVVLGPRHGHVKQSAFLLDLGRRPSAEIGRHASVHHIEHEDRLPFLALGRVDGGQDQVILIKQRHTCLVASGVGGIQSEVGQKARSRWIAGRDLLELQQIRLPSRRFLVHPLEMGRVPEARAADLGRPTRLAGA